MTRRPAGISPKSGASRRHGWMRWRQRERTNTPSQQRSAAASSCVLTRTFDHAPLWMRVCCVYFGAHTASDRRSLCELGFVGGSAAASVIKNTDFLSPAVFTAEPVWSFLDFYFFETIGPSVKERPSGNFPKMCFWRWKRGQGSRLRRAVPNRSEIHQTVQF